MMRGSLMNAHSRHSVDAVRELAVEHHSSLPPHLQTPTSVSREPHPESELLGWRDGSSCRLALLQPGVFAIIRLGIVPQCNRGAQSAVRRSVGMVVGLKHPNLALDVHFSSPGLKPALAKTPRMR